MRHAYLIIAHNEFEVLQRLVRALDDPRNDIYVHIDKKVKHLPELHTTESKLFVLDKRIDVRWGHVSQIVSEMRLFETAHNNGPYEFYHLISGTHMPLMSSDDLHVFFCKYQGKTIFSNLKESDGGYQEILKLHRMNLFLRGFHSENECLSRASQWLWKASVAFQRVCRIEINKNYRYFWANNWASFSEEAITYLLSIEKEIIRRYRFSFCGDEYFAPSFLMDSYLSATVLCENRLLFGRIGRSTAMDLTVDNYDEIVASGCCFARKFTNQNMRLIDLLEIWKNRD